MDLTPSLGVTRDEMAEVFGSKVPFGVAMAVDDQVGSGVACGSPIISIEVGAISVWWEEAGNEESGEKEGILVKLPGTVVDCAGEEMEMIVDKD